MARATFEKEKLLYLRDYLLKETDENHGKSMEELQDYLEGLKLDHNRLDRRSVAADLRLLGWTKGKTGTSAGENGENKPEKEPEPDGEESYRTSALTIKHRRIKDPDTKKIRTEYYIAQRLLSQKEVLMLTDMVASSNFLPQEESRALITKLKSLISAHESGELYHSQVEMKNRVKATNEEVYRNLNTLAEAINCHKRVSFQYFDFVFIREGGRAKRVLKTDRSGEEKHYTVTPDFLLWTDQNYYLIAYQHTEDERNGKEITFRVDRMTNMELTDGKLAKHKTELRDIYTTKVFHMYRGKEQAVELRFRDYLLTTMVDRFGEEIKLHKEWVRQDGRETLYYRTKVVVSVSPQFYGWVFGFGDAVQITWPEDARKGMAEQLQRSLEKYQKEE